MQNQGDRLLGRARDIQKEGKPWCRFALYRRQDGTEYFDLYYVDWTVQRFEVPAGVNDWSLDDSDL